MTRIQDFFNDLKFEMDNNEIITGLESGSICMPGYADIFRKPDGMVLFDTEEGGVDHWSAISINRMNKLKELRIKEGYTQQAWANLFDVKLNTVQKWEAGDSKPGLRSKKDIKKLLKVDVDALFADDDLQEIFNRR